MLDQTQNDMAAGSGPSDAFSTDNVAKKFRSAVGLASEEEMAAILQISHETLATWRTKKKGPPFIKLGKKVFYCIADFGKWVMHEVERQAERAPRMRRGERSVRQVHVDETQAGLHVHY